MEEDMDPPCPSVQHNRGRLVDCRRPWIGDGPMQSPIKLPNVRESGMPYGPSLAFRTAATRARATERSSLQPIFTKTRTEVFHR